jgi:hypothetical protein
MLAEETLVTDLKETLDKVKPRLEETLRKSLGPDGFLSDLEKRTLDSCSYPKAIAPFTSFDYKLYSSTAATAGLQSILSCKVPGTTDSFGDILSAISAGSSPAPHEQQHHCYLVGGQVRDVLRGVLSTDVDFNYSCDAKEVALVCVSHEWPTKYKCIGEGLTPNYALIGDEGSDNYLEGFSITFNATKACYTMDFRQNMCLYCLTNNVIIDKTGFGVEDIRAGALRLSCGAGESYTAWAGATITPGFKELRYIKFLLRASERGKPLKTDAAESAFVVNSLKSSMQSNADALKGFWFGYALDAQLKTCEGVIALREWVCKHGGEDWWRSDWDPLVRACANETALVRYLAVYSKPLPSASTAEVAKPKRRRRLMWWCKSQQVQIEPVTPGA